MFFNSIRWRLQLWHGLVLVLVLAGFGFTAQRLDRFSRMRRIDQELRMRAAIVMDALRRTGPPMDGPPAEGEGPPERRGGEPPAGAAQFAGEDEGDRLPPASVQLPTSDLALFNGSGSAAYYFFLWRRDGVVMAHSGAAPTDTQRPAKGGLSSDVRVRGNFREVYMLTPPGEVILVGLNMSGENAEMRRLAWLLFGAGGGVLVLGLAGGWWLSTRAIRPIRDISAAAGRISSGDLSQRINVEDTDNELGWLASVLNSTFARLEAAFDQQRQFTSDAAHELRTPVSVMLTQTQSTLKRERSANEYRSTVESCERAAQRMRRLIESLLELARLDAGQVPMKRLRFDLAETARECADLIGPLAEARGVKVSADLAPAQCTGDSERLGQVITNVLTNAVEYNKPGGEVRLATIAKNGTAVLTVADTGPGIAKEDIPRLFERFYRADKSRSSGHAGLGLAISKAIVDAHGGSIEVASEVGAGTTFTVRVPASK